MYISEKNLESGFLTHYKIRSNICLGKSKNVCLCKIQTVVKNPVIGIHRNEYNL